MSRRTVIVEDRRYEFAADDEPSRSQRWWGLIHAQVLDEITRRPPSSMITLISETPTVTPRVANDGAVGLVGIPQHVYLLTAPAFRVEVTAKTPGYIPRTISAGLPTQGRTIANSANPNDTTLQLNDVADLSEGVTLLVDVGGVNFEKVDISALGPGLNEVTLRQHVKHSHVIGESVVPVVPDNFAPLGVGPWELHREPVVIHGRVLESAGAGFVPVNNATVKIVDIWRTVTPVGVVVPPDTSVLLSLNPPLYRERAAPGNTLRQRNLPLAGVAIKRLLEPSNEGSLALRISDSVGLAVGDIVAIGIEDQAITEYAELQSVVGGSVPNQPAVITLTLPLHYQHRENSMLQKTNPQPLGPVNQLGQAGFQGDVCVFVDSVNGITSGGQIEVDDGATPERHIVSVFQVQSDADGFYTFPLIHRVGQIKLRAEIGAKSEEFVFQPDYAVRENPVNFIVK